MRNKNPISLKNHLEQNYTSDQIEAIEKGTEDIITRMKLKEQRERKKMTQIELAERANLPRSTITRFESGQANPTIDTLYRVAEALDMRLRVELESCN